MEYWLYSRCLGNDRIIVLVISNGKNTWWYYIYLHGKEHDFVTQILTPYDGGIKEPRINLMEKCTLLNLPKLCNIIVYDVLIKSFNGHKTQKPKYEGVKGRQSFQFTAEFNAVNASVRIMLSS